MKRHYVWLVCVAVTVAAAFLSLRPLVHHFAEGKLQQAFKAGKVTIKAIDWLGAGGVRLSSINIARAGIGDITVGEAEIHYSLNGIMHGSVARVLLHSVSLDIDQGALAKTPQAGSAVQTSLPFSLDQLTIVDLDVRSKQMGELMQNASVDIRNLQEGTFSADKAQWNKVSVTGIKSGIKLRPGELVLEPLTAHVLNGTLEGVFTVRMEKAPEFEGRFYFGDLEVVSFLEEFKLKDKLEGDGKVSGKLVVAGIGGRLTALDGSWSSGTGGMLTIKDTRILKRIAAFSKQREDIVVASLKDYHYNTGGIRLWLEKHVLVLALKMEGERGKRDIQVKLHDFLK